MSINPFTLRLQELQNEQQNKIEDNQQEMTQQDPQFESEVQQKNPFELRVQQKEKFDDSIWNGFMDMIFSPEETDFEKGLGQTLRGVSSSLGGMPGNTIQLIKSLAERGEKKLEEPDNFVKKYGKKILESFPTSDELLEKFDYLTENKYQPGSQTEQYLQDVAGDLAVLLTGAKTGNQVLKSIGAAFGGNLASEGMKELEFGDKAQSGAKIGTMAAIYMINPKGAKKYVDNLYNQAREALPPDARVSATQFERNLDNLENELRRGLATSPSKKPVLSEIKELKKNIKSGELDIRDAMQAKIDLNQIRTEKIYDPELRGKSVRKQLKENFSKVSKTLDDAILEYGQGNPEFLKHYKDAQLGWGGLENSKKISQSMGKALKKYKFQSSLGAIPLYYFPGAIPTAAKIGSVAYGGTKAAAAASRLMNKPLRKYYMNALLEASKNNYPGVIKNIKKLDNEMLKQDLQGE